MACAMSVAPGCSSAPAWMAFVHARTKAPRGAPLAGKRAPKARQRLDVLVTRQKRLKNEPTSFFVDWVSIYQEHGQTLPVVCAGYVWEQSEEGEVLWRSVDRLARCSKRRST